MENCCIEKKAVLYYIMVMEVKMSDPAYKLDEYFTYADYVLWDTSNGLTQERFELVDGIAYSMGAPTVAHQIISMELSGAFFNYFKDKSCRVFAAPFDVRLFPKNDESDDTVFQPDISVICDKTKLVDGRACKGAPDLVIEILSNSSIMMDRKIKPEKYLKAGVKEYWIVDSKNADVYLHRLINGEYSAVLYTDIVRSNIFPGLEINLDLIRKELQPA